MIYGRKTWTINANNFSESYPYNKLRVLKVTTRMDSSVSLATVYDKKRLKVFVVSILYDVKCSRTYLLIRSVVQYKLYQQELCTRYFVKEFQFRQNYLSTIL